MVAPDQDDCGCGSDTEVGGQADTGPEPATKCAGDSGSLRLAVPEMDCPTCGTTVESALADKVGIQTVDSLVSSGQVTVTFDPDQTSTDKIIEAIEATGYEATAITEDAAAPERVIWQSTRGYLTWTGAVFLVAGLGVMFGLPEADVKLLTLPWTTVTVSGLLLLVATVISGGPIVKNGYYSYRMLSLDIDFLMGTAIVIATGLGLFVEGATLAVLYSIAELLEQYSMDRARHSLRELMELAPSEATRVVNGTEEVVQIDELTVGDRVAVRPGERVPTDGEVLAGTSPVDESPVTGESVPVDKGPGDEVYAGTVLADGYLEIEVTAPAADSTLSRIIQLVREAEADTTDYEQFVDRFASYYTPAVVVIAILTAVLPVLLAGADWETWLVRGLTFLVLACPCAFVISTPVSVVSGITSAARNGVLIKGGRHLEAMGDVDVVAIDKTGTLTHGHLEVTDVVPIAATSDQEVLDIAGAIEAKSEHPIGAAIIEQTETTPEVSDFEARPGLGVAGVIDGEEYFVGKPQEFGDRLSEPERNLEPDTVESTDCPAVFVDDLDSEEQTGKTTFTPATGIQELQTQGKTVVVVGTDDAILGIIALQDTARSGAGTAIDRLREHGVSRVVMLTGDNQATADAVGGAVGVDEVRAELLPDEKIEAVSRLQDEYGTVAMVGDGINDAPALAAADVGIAMGAAGTDAAIETADIALLGDDLSKLPYLYRLSNRAQSVIRENIGSSLAVKALLAIGVPFGYVTVAIAILVGDMGMSLGVTGNAMRLSRLGPEE